MGELSFQSPPALPLPLPLPMIIMATVSLVIPELEYCYNAVRATAQPIAALRMRRCARRKRDL